MKVDSGFRFVPFDKCIIGVTYIGAGRVDPKEEIYKLFEDPDAYLIDTALLYKDVLVLQVYSPHYPSHLQYIAQLPDLKLMKILWELDSEHTKRLVNWYIGYEASDFEEVKTYFMAKILGDDNGLVGI